MPRSGEQHPDYPGCRWSPPLNTYACDDGYDINGNPLPDGWEKSFQSLPSDPFAGASVDGWTSNVTIKAVGEVSPAQLSSLIRSNGGAYVAAISDPLVAAASSAWWKFSVQFSADGSQARITENSYLLYAGIGLGALLIGSLVLSRR